jgi:predicted flap endonuclease-1-like 5' DNA nuclease
MIWHFLEVWLLVAVAFGIGCGLGAYLYGVIGDSRLAPAQGALADGIGDVFDGIKMRLGLGPAWRPHHLRAVERPTPQIETMVPQDAEEPEEDDIDYENDVQALNDEQEFVEVALEESGVVEPPSSRAPASSEISSRPIDARAPSRVQTDESLFVGGDPERVQSAMAIGDDGVVPMRPAGLSRPRGGVPDNLTRIRGIGGRNEDLLNSLGIYHFGQIAAWTPGEVRWIGQYLAFPERIERDNWVGQAMVLASGGETGFEKSAERRRRRRRLEQQAFLARQVALGVASVMKGDKAPDEVDEPDAANELDVGEPDDADESGSEPPETPSDQAIENGERGDDGKQRDD